MVFSAQAPATVVGFLRHRGSTTRWPVFYTSLVLAILLPNPSHAGYELLRGNLFGRVTTGAEADSNIYFNSLQTGDFIITAIPEVGFKRDVGLIMADMSAGFNVKRFINNTVNNDENPFASALVNWTSLTGKSDGKLLALARELAQANPDVNQLTLSEQYVLDAAFGHFVTEKFGYRLHSRYSDEDFLTAGLNGVREFEAGLDARHRFLSKLESFLSYNFRTTSTFHRRPGTLLIDSRDQQLSLGLDGALLSKVSGRVGAGWVTRRFDITGRSESGPLVNASVKWQWKENVALNLTARRDFDTSAAEQSILRTSVAVGAQVQVGAKMELSGGASYSHDNYSGGVLPRVDDTCGLDFRCVYTFSRRLQGAIYARYLTVDSTSAFGSYNQIVVGLSVALKL